MRDLPKRFGGIHEYSVLKRMPRGFAEDHPAARWLKHQSFTSGRSFTDTEVTSPKLERLLAREFEALLPLVRWVNGALGLRAQELMGRAARAFGRVAFLDDHS